MTFNVQSIVSVLKFKNDARVVNWWTRAWLTNSTNRAQIQRGATTGMFFSNTIILYILNQKSIEMRYSDFYEFLNCGILPYSSVWTWMQPTLQYHETICRNDGGRYKGKASTCESVTQREERLKERNSTTFCIFFPWEGYYGYRYYPPSPPPPPPQKINMFLEHAGGHRRAAPAAPHHNAA